MNASYMVFVAFTEAAIQTIFSSAHACKVSLQQTRAPGIPKNGSCQIWSGEFLNTLSSSSDNRSTVSIRLAASALPKFHKPPSSSKLKTIIILSGLALALALSIFSFLMWRKYRLRRPVHTSEDSLESSLRMFSYMKLKIATRNFRSKLGSGGFGSVFKGSLTWLVVVKRIQTITSNSRSKQKVLDWKTRLQIALGTAQGLVYLRGECRECIIHGDVKPENFLLDSGFSPKLADFGLAKLVGRDFSRVLTTTRGTKGYLAPEWISELPITPKVDVYVFGITLLKIISGRRSLDFTVQDSSKYYFPAWAATQIYQGEMISIVDEGVAAEADIEEVRRVN
ncbi:hypothetical protein SUGI_0536360 [Cryptomeria japonica]|nr:hypothetical protein SUGI_0536360 [Cryptomeria japonica]